MTKKKPDFLRDLDTAIMDELTGGGIKGNAAGLVGTLTQIKEIKQLCGLPFCGYMAKLETVRPSGVPDEVTVVFAEDVPYRACNGIEFDVMQEFVEGSRLLLTGKAQTLKDFQSGRLLVYILADFVAVSEKAVEQDEVAVRGVIANKPTHRETPRGKPQLFPAFVRYLRHCSKLLYLMPAVFSVFLAYLMVCKRFERCQIPYVSLCFALDNAQAV